MRDLSKVKTIIGWQLTRDTVARIMKIDQSAFIRDLIIKERLTKCNTNVIPMKAGSSIKMSESDDYDKTDIHTYQQLIGKLIYLACGTRPNIVFAIGQLSKHNADLRKKDLQATKRVVQFMKGTMNLGLVYGQIIARDSLPYDLISYVDSNFAGDLKDCKLMMGYCFFLNGVVV